MTHVVFQIIYLRVDYSIRVRFNDIIESTLINSTNNLTAAGFLLTSNIISMTTNTHLINILLDQKELRKTLGMN